MSQMEQPNEAMGMQPASPEGTSQFLLLLL